MVKKAYLNDVIRQNDSKYNLFFAMIFDKEKLDHRGTYFVPKILSTKFYL